MYRFGNGDVKCTVTSGVNDVERKVRKPHSCQGGNGWFMAHGFRGMSRGCPHAAAFRSVDRARLPRSTSRPHFCFTDHGDDCGSHLCRCTFGTRVSLSRCSFTVCDYHTSCFEPISPSVYGLRVSRSSRQSRLRLLRNAKKYSSIAIPAYLSRGSHRNAEPWSLVAVFFRTVHRKPILVRGAASGNLAS